MLHATDVLKLCRTVASVLSANTAAWCRCVPVRIARGTMHVMDDIVQQAMAKWPNVPACYGWLGLDARGRWFLRDDAVQACGPFPESKGSLLEHEKLLAFIARNYAADAQGQWFFQNGPQRVYVDLEVAPWVWRIEADLQLRTHTGLAACATECLLDEQGRVYLDSAIGLGLVHTLDMLQVADALEQGLWQTQSVQASELPLRYGFVRHPHAAVAKTSPSISRKKPA